MRPVAVPLVQQRNLILQQDNARSHVARVCQDFLANNNIAPLAWPPYSQDLTLIEHMWNELDRRVRKRRNPQMLLGLHKCQPFSSVYVGNNFLFTALGSET